MRRSRDQWAQIVEEFERSGLSHEVFCAQQRLNVGSFRGWLYRLRSGSPRLLPVRVGPPSASGDEDLVEVASGGVTVRLRSGVGPSYVAELVSRLRDRC